MEGKKTKRHIPLLLIHVPAVCLLLAACSASCPAGTPDAAKSLRASELRILTIGTADSGGTMYPAGKAIAEIIGDSDSQIKVNLSASHGSSDNVKALESGDIDLGLVSGDVAFSAVNGTGEFSNSPADDLRTVAALYPSLSNWMVRSSSGLSWVHELRGRKLGIGPQDSTTELTAKLVLNSMGITERNSELRSCGLGSGAGAVQKGTLDAIHGFTGIPINGLSQLAEAVPCTLLKYTDSELDAVLKENAFYYRAMIPAGTYEGQEEDVSTFGLKCLLCVRADMEEDLVYELTSILYRNIGSLKAAHAAFSSLDQDGFMYSELPIPLHSGAERFYREEGLLP